MTDRMALSLVRGTISPERLEEIAAPYRAATARGLPSTMAATYLLSDASGTVAIATIWHDRADLDAMIASNDEPFARRLIRQAGGDPQAEFFDVVATSEASAKP